MKKLLAGVLIITTLLCSPVTFVNAKQSVYETDERIVERQITVSQNKKYTTEYTNATPLENYEDEGNQLTDGAYGPVIDYKNTDWVESDSWVGYRSADGKNDYSVTVTVDLGYVAQGIGQVFIRTMTEKRISGMTPQILIEGSVDGSRYFSLGMLEVQNQENKKTEVLINRMKLEKTFSARYIRVTYTQTAKYTVLTDEITVSAFGEKEQLGQQYQDKHGNVYDISSGYAVKNGRIENVEKLVPGYAHPTETDFNVPNTSFVIGKGIGREITVVNDFMTADKPYYSHYVNDIRYIVIHNTGMCEDRYDAYGVHNYLVHKTDGSSTSWHYTVDSNIIYHGLPDTTVGWHAASNYNFYTIGIEMCLNGAPVGPGGNNYPITEGEEFESWYRESFVPTIENTAVLTAELLVKYGLTPDKILQHNDVYYFNAKQCPYYMRLNENQELVHDGYGWIYFMELVNEYFSAMTSEGERTASTDYSYAITEPDYVIDSNGTAYLSEKNRNNPPAIEKGDANGNCMIDMDDAHFVKEILLENKRCNGMPDIDGDERITLADYLLILRKI